jgi:putative membrane protein
MMGFGMMGGMFLFWIALILLAVFLARGLFQPSQASNGSRAPLTASEILEQRYARGEITQEQFLQMQKDLK